MTGERVDGALSERGVGGMVASEVRAGKQVLKEDRQERQGAPRGCALPNSIRHPPLERRSRVMRGTHKRDGQQGVHGWPDIPPIKSGEGHDG